MKPVSVAEAQMQQALAMSEDELQSNVLALAHALGWLVHHDRPARTGRLIQKKDGTFREEFLTHVQGDEGFVDIVLAKGGRVLCAELKSEKTQSMPTPAQYEWMRALGASWRLWRPLDWMEGTIQRELEGA